MALKLMYITNNPQIALIAINAGVDRIFVDLEMLNKEERQKNIDSVKSRHSFEDISKIKRIIGKADLLVRVNPIYSDSEVEISKAINAGASIVMLPMWKSVNEVRNFIAYVNRRARTCLLLETKEAVECIDEVLKIHGIDEIHIGLNDLHLSYNMTFMFELVANGTVEKLCNKIKARSIPYGFGGIAKLDEGLLPAHNIVAEHYRLNSSMTILSRSFCDTTNAFGLSTIEKEFNTEIVKLREYEKELSIKNQEFFSKNVQTIKDKTAQIVEIIKNRRSIV